MTQGKIVPLLLKFSAPLLLGNLFQQFYNTFDTFIVGRVIGSQALAAIGSTSHFVNTVINFFNGLAIGAQVVISQFFGAKNFPSLKKAINTTIFSSLIFSLFVTIIQIIISPYILRLISTPPDVLVQANQYLKIYFLGTAALTIYNMGSGILRALGDSTRALIFLVISSVSNIILDILFVVLLGKGIAGAAYATVLSELLSAILVIISLQRLEVKMRLELKHPQIDYQVQFLLPSHLFQIHLCRNTLIILEHPAWLAGQFFLNSISLLYYQCIVLQAEPLPLLLKITGQKNQREFVME